jgi:hypothetical protein
MRVHDKGAQNREQLKSLLRQLFQFDSADLDFGIYRIMNAKRSEVERFIEEDLLDAVEQGLAHLQAGERRRGAAPLGQPRPVLRQDGRALRRVSLQSRRLRRPVSPHAGGGAPDNAKGNSRYFVLRGEEPLAYDAGSGALTVFFEYRRLGEEEIEGLLAAYNRQQPAGGRRKTLDRAAPARMGWMVGRLAGREWAFC